MIRSASLWLVLIHVSIFCQAADWPTYLQNNARIGATTEQLVTPLHLQWVYSAPEPPELAWAGPRSTPIEGKEMRHRVAFDRGLDVAVVGDLLYFGSSVDHKINCVDAKTGEPRWHFFTDGPVRLSPTVWQGKVYAGSDDGHVYCLDAHHGSLIWKIRVAPDDQRLLARGRMISRWPVRTGVMVDDGIAYFGAGVFPHETVYLCAADATTGSIIWRNDRISQEDAGRNDLSPQGYLLCNRDQLFVPSGRSLPVSFSRENGSRVFSKSHSWRTTAGGVVGGYKAIVADGQIYTSGPHHFLAMDEKTGNVGFAWITGRQFTLSGDKGYVATGTEVFAIDRLQHTKATIQRQKLNLELYDLRRKRNEIDRDEFNSRVKELEKGIAELSQIGVLWSTQCDCDASLVLAKNKLFIGGQGRVIGLDANSGREDWKSDVDGLASGLAVANGRLFVSTDQGKIYGYADAVNASKNSAVGRYPASRNENPYAEDDLAKMYRSAAELIVQQSGVTRGFCLVVGSENGQLAYELAKRTKLRIYGIEPNENKAAQSRRLLDAAAIHGTRVTIVHGNPTDMPFSNYFANLVVSDTMLLTGEIPGDPTEVARCVKPVGGVLCLAMPDGAPGAKLKKESRSFTRVVAALQPNSTHLNVQENAEIATRGKLPGTGDWSHQYGDVANTSMSKDYRVKGGMSVLWYGDPGPAPMINRHEAAAAPLSTNGRLFIQGLDSILCYDAYNGLFLWEYKNPGALRTGVFNNEDTSNLAASDDLLFVAVDETCTVLDAATGQVHAQYQAPQSSDGVPRVWGYVGFYDGLLLGTSTIRTELAEALRRRGLNVTSRTDAIFAIDVKTGERKWAYPGENVMHMTIAVGDDRVFFIDSSITQQHRESLLRADKTALKGLNEAQAKEKEDELKQLDIRLAVALDARTGKELWSKPVDVTNCSRVGIGGGELTLIYQDDHVLICGANANGHYWRQFLSGQFKERRLVVLDANTGEKLWDKDANYRHRPILVENEIIAEPWKFDLHTGEEKQRVNPVTGQMTTWQFSRPGHHCGMLTATPNTLFFRSGFTGYYDLYSDSGSSHFAGHRTGCWINVIPGNGLVMVPEASAGCVCQFSIASTVVLEPREDRDTWRIYSATGAKTPVKHLAINLGAPGDRRDEFGTLWLAFPRPKIVGRLEYEFDVKSTFVTRDDGYFSQNSESTKIERADTPWVFTSGARGLTRCRIPLLGDGDDPATYTVKLYFAEIDEEKPSQREFDIELQGATVAQQLDIVKEAGGANRGLIRTFEAIEVSDDLIVELVPRTDRPPVLAAIEVIQQ